MVDEKTEEELKGESTLTIENPDAPVNLGGEFIDVNGVMIAKELLERDEK